MILRPATPDDVAALAALETVVLGGEAWSRAAVRDEVEGPGRRVVLAVAEDVTGAEVLVGYAATMTVGDVVDLQRIAVRSSYRRRGVARALLGEAFAEAAARGAARMLLEVSARNASAAGLYAAAGFVEIHRRRRYYRDGSDAVVMSRTLEDAARAGRGWTHG
jgi:ribosomal-protein-alanine N-acetyltransferase